MQDTLTIADRPARAGAELVSLTESIDTETGTNRGLTIVPGFGYAGPYYG